MEFKTITRLNRFKEIVVSLVRFGFDDLVERLEIPGKELLRKIHPAARDLNTYQRIRHVLEDLGPTFIKFGQIMSLRPDMLPIALIEELRKLQDEVPAEGFAEIRPAVETSLKRPLEAVFAEFGPEPVAAASLSQVHRAVLKDTREVVAVKVQRPGIRHTVEADLDILEGIAHQLHQRVAGLQVYDLPRMVQITRRTLLRELDFRREARNMQVAEANLPEERDISVPRAYLEYTTAHLLVMEFVTGTKLKELDPQTLMDPHALARQGLRAAIRQVLADGFFHADPHPGNMLVTPDQNLCLIDWGMVGRLTETDRDDLLRLLKAVVEKDSQALVEAVLVLAATRERVDRRALERDLLDILDAHFSIALKDVQLGRLLLDLSAVLREYHLRLPPDLIIMIKALLTAEGTARQLYPDLNVLAEAEDFVEGLARRRLSPRRLWRQFQGSLVQFLALNRQIPVRLAEIVDKLDRGELNIRFEHENLGGLRHTLESVSNRLTLGVIIGAMIIGSSMIITTGIHPLLFGYPAFGIIGYLISALLGLWLVFTIIRSRRY